MQTIGFFDELFVFRPVPRVHTKNQKKKIKKKEHNQEKQTLCHIPNNSVLFVAASVQQHKMAANITNIKSVKKPQNTKVKKKHNINNKKKTNTKTTKTYSMC